MKKLLLTLGTVAAVAAPVASVIACGSSNETKNPSTNLFAKYEAKINTNLATHEMKNIDDKTKKLIESLEAIKEDEGATFTKQDGNGWHKVVRKDHDRYFFKALPTASDNAILEALQADETAQSNADIFKNEYGLTDDQIKEAKYYIDVFTGTEDNLTKTVNTKLNFRHDSVHHANVHAVFGIITATGIKGVVAFQESDGTTIQSTKSKDALSKLLASDGTDDKMKFEETLGIKSPTTDMIMTVAFDNADANALKLTITTADGSKDYTIVPKA